MRSSIRSCGRFGLDVPWEQPEHDTRSRPDRQAPAAEVFGERLLQMSAAMSTFRDSARPLSPAQVAPLCESVPPRLYGGTEPVVAYLTDEFVRRGHSVTLFASGDSRTRGQLAPVSQGAAAEWIQERMGRDPFDADYADIFEVRGSRRARRGERLCDAGRDSPVMVTASGAAATKHDADSPTRSPTYTTSRP